MITVRAEKSTRFPHQIPRIRPSLPFNGDGLERFSHPFVFLAPIFGVGLVVEQRVDFILEQLFKLRGDIWPSPSGTGGQRPYWP